LKSDTPKFFRSPADLRRWFAKNHSRTNELWIGFHCKESRRPSITWPQAVDEALCFGWIDGIRKRIANKSYKIRFTPRREKSTWSAINIARVTVLTREGRMEPAGEAAFARREETNSRRYSFENRETAKLSRASEREFRRDSTAWEFFQRQPPGYRRVASWWVISAKRAETRRKRLQRLIDMSRDKRRIYS
jgi:uncharacterized protein YdeI (YjbR/CyaY-like superfamily)